jgi:hypothetical protein
MAIPATTARMATMTAGVLSDPVNGSSPGVVVAPEAALVVVAPDVVVVVATDVVVVGALRSHVGVLNVSVSSVTAPLRARARPCTVTPVVTLIDVRARIVPTNVDPVPRVAELPTCQNTLHCCAPLINVTVLPDAVMSVESVWKMNTEFGSPAPSRVKLPARVSGDLAGPA